MGLSELLGQKTFTYALYLVGFILTYILVAFFIDVVVMLSLRLVLVFIILMRFLSGIGILGTIFVGLTYFFKFVPKDMRKKRKVKLLAKAVVYLAIIASAVVPILEIVKLVIGISMVSLMSVLYGTVLFVFTVYVIPVWKGKPVEDHESIKDKIKGALGKISRKIKKFYYRYFTKDLLSLYTVEFLYLKARLDHFKQKLSWRLAPIIIIATLFIPPLAFVALIALARMKIGISNVLDKLVLCSSFIMIPIFMYITASILPAIPVLWAIPYVIGAMLCIIMFWDALIDILKL